ncbi:hypothetical protein C8J56DRAFT_908465 [Mycena floridula]|nr:hypothetical protein C8J56DRAFT_908465 [Mycena floridula]
MRLTLSAVTFAVFLAAAAHPTLQSRHDSVLQARDPTDKNSIQCAFSGKNCNAAACIAAGGSCSSSGERAGKAICKAKPAPLSKIDACNGCGCKKKYNPEKSGAHRAKVQVQTEAAEAAAWNARKAAQRKTVENWMDRPDHVWTPPQGI